MSEEVDIGALLDRWAVAGARRWLTAHLARHGPESGTEIAFAGGIAVFAGVDSPLSKVVGCSEPIQAADLDTLHEFYDAHGSRFEIEVSPLADPTLIACLEARGYEWNMTEVALVRPNEPEEEGASPPDLPEGIDRIERLPEFGGERAARVLASFGLAPEPPSELLLEVGRTSLSQSGTVGWVAVSGGQDVACACHAVEDGGIASLFGAATSPEFRGRGIQRAMIEDRVAEIATTTAEWVVLVAGAGTTSERNAIRAGFYPVHSWQLWGRP